MPVQVPLLYGELEEVIPALPFGARSRRVCHGGWGPGGGAVTAAGRLSCYCKYEYILITGSPSFDLAVIYYYYRSEGEEISFTKCVCVPVR